MNDTMFDVWARRTVRAIDRRAVLGLLGSMLLATIPSPSLAGNDRGHGSSGGGKHGGGSKHDTDKKGGKDKGGKKKKKRSGKDGLSREECEKNYGTCTDYWAGYCNGYPTTDLRVNCQSSFISCCADLLTCTEHANARHVECVSLMDQIW